MTRAGRWRWARVGWGSVKGWAVADWGTWKAENPSPCRAGPGPAPWQWGPGPAGVVDAVGAGVQFGVAGQGVGGLVVDLDQGPGQQSGRCRPGRRPRRRSRRRSAGRSRRCRRPGRRCRGRRAGPPPGSAGACPWRAGGPRRSATRSPGPEPLAGHRRRPPTRPPEPGHPDHDDQAGHGRRHHHQQPQQRPKAAAHQPWNAAARDSAVLGPK
jgi:hypothetical protein